MCFCNIICLCTIDLIVCCTNYACRSLLNSFLMEVCELKNIKLGDIDYKSTEALCFFINIYHTLLLHARLIIGRPNKTVSLMSYFRYSDCVVILFLHVTFYYLCRTGLHSSLMLVMK